MNTEQLEKWNQARVVRDRSIEQCDIDRAEREAAEKREREAEFKRNRIAAAAREEKAEAVRGAMIVLLRRAAEFGDIYEAAKVAGFAAADSRRLASHPMGDRVFQFLQMASEAAQFKG